MSEETSMRKHTRRKRLLELLGLLGVLEDESVQVARAADLELGLLGGAALLYPGRCDFLPVSACFFYLCFVPQSSDLFLPSVFPGGGGGGGSARTGCILAAADLDELLDVGDLRRHGDGVCVRGRKREGSGVSSSCFFFFVFAVWRKAEDLVGFA